MGLFVLRKRWEGLKSFVTSGTSVDLFAVVRVQVLFQIGFAGERFGTKLALERSLSGVRHSLVDRQGRPGLGCVVALPAVQICFRDGFPRDAVDLLLVEIESGLSLEPFSAVLINVTSQEGSAIFFYHFVLV